MRALSREQLNSRSEFIRRCGWVVISTASLTVLAACGGGGGGGSDPPPPANVAPTVQAGADQTIEWPVATAQLTGTATDSSTTTLTYTWSATSGPAGVTFGTANAAATSVTFPSEGSYTLRLSVSDGSLSGTDDVLVTVSPAVYPASDTANSDPDHGWLRVNVSTDVGMAEAPLVTAANYALTGGGAGMIVRRGRLVRSWGNIDQRYDMKSTSKSIGGMALGVAIDNGSLTLAEFAKPRLTSLGAPAPTTTPAWLDQITILQLATHTAGFLKEDVYNEGTNTTTYAALQYQPGSTWFYSDSGLNWLSEVLTAVFNADLATVLNTEVWTTLGLNAAAGGPDGSAPSNIDVKWRDNQFRLNPAPGSGTEKRELASGIYANVNAMARVGLLFLRKGVWGTERVLSESFTTTVRTPQASVAAAANPQSADFPGATTNYGVLWWTNANGVLPNVPRDAFWAWGLGDSLIVVIPSLDIVVVRAGPQQQAPTAGRTWNDSNWNGDYAVLAPFLDPIVQSVSP
jgi:CubicO group peptidase (beta-lactamase class C family)